ncbi:hypothetical protein BKA70DRAFT_59999 [Coprinopsis sp. MPI-PUGE-AT-0042]|nr:hypothetical protein BKA70DRAFT_59999 [Coprinopsis sp. MPI-PUGE-AT-0042]
MLSSLAQASHSRNRQNCKLMCYGLSSCILVSLSGRLTSLTGPSLLHAGETSLAHPVLIATSCFLHQRPSFAQFCDVRLSQANSSPSPTAVSSLEPYQMPIPSDIFNPLAVAAPHFQTSPPPAANADTIPALEAEGEKDTHPHRPDLADPAFPRDGMAPWPYLAIAVIVIVLGVVVGYAMYSCWRSMSLVRRKSRAAKKGSVQDKEQGDECDEYAKRPPQKDNVESEGILTSPRRRKESFIHRVSIASFLFSHRDADTACVRSSADAAGAAKTGTRCDPSS